MEIAALWGALLLIPCAVSSSPFPLSERQGSQSIPGTQKALEMNILGSDEGSPAVRAHV